MTQSIDRRLVGKKPHFRPARGGNNFYRVILWLSLIIVAGWVYLSLERGQIPSPFDPTPTPTRLPQSYFLQAQAYFEAGKLDDPSNNQPGSTEPPINDAIEAYQAALAENPNNPENAAAWAELARIEAYSSSLLRNDAERRRRLETALQHADKAVELAPDVSSYHAIRAFVLDWLAFNSLVLQERDGELSAEYLVQADRSASRAFQLDPQNPLALAFYAEILADNQKWQQAEKYAAQAVALGEDMMDTHRVYGYVLETLGQYNAAIQQYLRAAEINPNLTFLYIRIGVNYREGLKNADRALEYFDRAAKIDAQLEVNNPLPYIEIARTYTQQGQFFAAMVNAEKALSLDNQNANTYGQLGIIFRRARNYEGANPLLKCAVKGCTAEENEMGKVPVEGLELSSVTVAYYYVEYGTNLAFLSRPSENFCPEAMPVLAQVKQAAVQWNDPYLISIAEDSEGLCRRVDAEVLGITATPEPETTPMHGAEGGMEEPTSTPAP